MRKINMKFHFKLTLKEGVNKMKATDCMGE